MPAKHSKTEHVLKLLTNDEEGRADVMSTDNLEKDEKTTKAATGSGVRKNTASPRAKKEPDVKSDSAQGPESELNSDQRVLQPERVIVKNIVEDIVDNKLHEMIGRLECCNCGQCLMDIKACTLNSLSPKYIATQEGKLYSKIMTYLYQYEADVTSAITKAAMIISNNPRH